MKKKIICISLSIIVVLVVMFVPFRKNEYDDGGTVEYVALTYKVVKWKRYIMPGESIYESTRVYWLGDKKPISELWERELEIIEANQK